MTLALHPDVQSYANGSVVKWVEMQGDGVVVQQCLPQLRFALGFVKLELYTGFDLTTV